MQVLGAVYATKTLRSKSDPIEGRVSLAHSLLTGTHPARLPRKHIVILDWIFDALATDAAARHYTGSWKLLIDAWNGSDEASRLRSLRSHKLLVYIAEALSESPDKKLLGVVAEAAKGVMNSADIVGLASDSQVSQLVLSYLKCEVALGDLELGTFVFHAASVKVRLFGTKMPLDTLDVLLKEPLADRRRRYLEDYLASPNVPVVPANDLHLETLLEAICQSDLNIQERILALVDKYPLKASLAISIMEQIKPKGVSAEFISNFLPKIEAFTKDWELIWTILRINPAPLLADFDLVRATLDSNPPQDVLQFMINKSVAIRRFGDLLSLWPSRLELSEATARVFKWAIDSLSPTQIAPLIQSDNNLMLSTIVEALSYPTVAHPAIQNGLQMVYEAENAPSRAKIAALNVFPHIEFANPSKSDDTWKVLREIELLGDSSSIVNSVLKRIETGEQSEVLIRFYPLLEREADTKRLLKAVKKADPHTRLQIARCHDALEYEKITEALIDVCIVNEEIETLLCLPKQVYSWDQRHRAVGVALKGSLKKNGVLVADLLDPQNLPDASKVSAFLATAEPVDASILLSLTRLLIKHRDYMRLIIADSLQDWQRVCILAQADENNEEALAWVYSEVGNVEYQDPVLEVLNLVANAPGANRAVELLAVSMAEDLPQLLFRIVCQSNYHWSIVTALFLESKSKHDSEFVSFCRKLPSDELKSLAFESASEMQLEVLDILVKNHLITGEKYRRVFTALLARACSQESHDSPQLWRLCDSLLRDEPSLLSQFSLETILAMVARLGATSSSWGSLVLVTSRALLVKRQSLRGRLSLVVAALTSLMKGVDSVERAASYSRLVGNLCNPSQYTVHAQTDKLALNSSIAKERRQAAKQVDVLLQNLVFLILSRARVDSRASMINTALRPAAYWLIDSLGADRLRATSAGMDSSSRAYLRNLFGDYKLHAKWTSDD